MDRIVIEYQAIIIVEVSAVEKQRHRIYLEQRHL